MGTAEDEHPALRAGIALLRTRQASSAEALLESAARDSQSAKAWHYLGVARHVLRKLASAAAAFRRSLELDESNPEVYTALTVVLGQSGDWAEAERILARGLERLPEEPVLHFNLAVVLENRGADAEALRHYVKALRYKPDYPEALLNRGALHLRAERYAEALADFDALLAAAPDSADAWLNRARVLLQLHRDDEALQAVRAAQRLSPQKPEARLLASTCLASMGNIEAAMREVSTVDPNWDAEGMYLLRGLFRQDACEWHDRDRVIEGVRRLMSTPEGAARLAQPGLYIRMLALPLPRRALRTAADALAAALVLPVPGVELSSPRRQRIRIGLFCEGVGRHPETYLLRPLASLLDRERFELRLYALNADDGTQLRRDFASRADAFADVSALDSLAIVEFARREELDVAIDAGGWFRPARPEIFKARVAPLQVAYLATPGPNGGGLVDYRFSDAWTTPPEWQPDWSEKLVLLPPPHWVYDNQLAPGPAGTRGEHGLPAQGFVFCCITQPWKLEPESFSIWMRLLRAVEGSVLWLVDGGMANERVRKAAAGHGVAPDRLVFAPRVELDAHLGRLRHADLFLDTFYFTAQTTAIDTLWAGVPIVTRTRPDAPSNLTAALLRSAGLDDLATESSEAYETTALRLAREPLALRRYRDILSAARSGAPLFDTAARVRAFERAVTAIVERHRAGLPPDTLVVE